MTSKKKTSRYNPWKFLITFFIVMGLFAAVRHVFAIHIPLHTDTWEVEDEDELFAYTEDINSDATQEDEDTDEQEWEDIDTDSTAPTPVTYDAEPDSTPYDYSHHETVVNSPEDNLRIENPTYGSTAQPHNRIRGVVSYAKCFDDIQDIQLLAAKKHGITPVRNRKQANRLIESHKLVNISHSPFYVVDSLTHSIPYLVPRAQHLLNTICLNFIDSCHVKGLPPHLPIITSVLRTTDDVSNLQRGNKNATTHSCHCYGTTVDIAYNRFMPVTGTYDPHATPLRWNEPMKQVLAEVLYDLRKQHKCYVKYERKQGCFHLTCK